MFNHLTLAKKLRSSTYRKTLEVYEREIRQLPTGGESLRNYLLHLNYFLYTYFLLEFGKDLEKLGLSYEKAILRESHPQKLIALGKKILNGYKNSFAGEVSDNDHELVESALHFINRNFTKKITLQIVADRLHISKNYLCHLFKQKTGYKFCEYINILRINLAKDRIRENQKTFEFISYECGFSSQSHFSTTFKKYTGMTPNEFKKSVVRDEWRRA